MTTEIIMSAADITVVPKKSWLFWKNKKKEKPKPVDVGPQNYVEPFKSIYYSLANFPDDWNLISIPHKDINDDIDRLVHKSKKVWFRINRANIILSFHSDVDAHTEEEPSSFMIGDFNRPGNGQFANDRFIAPLVEELYNSKKEKIITGRQMLTKLVLEALNED